MAQNTFHVALSVKDLSAAIDHYKKILGIEPAKVKADYAKFEIADPPVILSLNPGSEPGKVLHLGIRYPETEQVDTALHRSKAQGLEVREQPGNTCCYAVADKFWVHDADGLAWEMYSLLADAEVHSRAATPSHVCCQPATAPATRAQTKTNSCCGPAVAPSDLVQIQS
jgi:catechol 2,3-dioxygenase-like lactoylglutathione lyase family enzyme